MNWTAIIITLIICFTATMIAEIIEKIFEKKYSRKSFIEGWFGNNNDKEENK